MHSTVLDGLGVGVYYTFAIIPIFGVRSVRETADQDLETGYTTFNADIVLVVMNYWISFVRDLSPNQYPLGCRCASQGGDGTCTGRTSKSVVFVVQRLALAAPLLNYYFNIR